MRTHEIQIEHDQFDTPESYQAYALHGKWLVEQQTAADLVSNWRYERERTRSFTETSDGFVLAALDPRGAPVIGLWERNAEGLYLIADFPFKTQITATTAPPPEVQPRPEPRDADYAAFGKVVTAILASSTDWNGDVIASISEMGPEALGVPLDVSEMDEPTWLMWEAVVGRRGYEMPEMED